MRLHTADISAKTYSKLSRLEREFLGPHMSGHFNSLSVSLVLVHTNARLTLARLLATILPWQVVPFWDTNWEAPSLFTTSSHIVHDTFTTSSQIVHECVPISVHIDTNWRDEFTHSLRIVYALPTLARRVCAIRTVSRQLKRRLPQPLVIFGSAVDETTC